MTAPVDVQLKLVASRLRDPQRMNARSKQVYADKLDGVAGDVRELAAAARIVDDLNDEYPGADRLRAALARIGATP